MAGKEVSDPVVREYFEEVNKSRELIDKKMSALMDVDMSQIMHYSTQARTT
ncbi:MAG TPA: hypothetical protein VGD40_03255 [Chryseosolibacter sp.]